MKKVTTAICIVAIVYIGLTNVADAITLQSWDLTDPAPPLDDSVVINGAIFEQYQVPKAGTGNLEPFVRIQLEGGKEGGSAQSPR